MNITSTEAKWISIFIVGIGSFAIGVIPLCCISRRRDVPRKLFLSVLLCFGGGVLFATSVLHMLPETREELPEYAELTFCCGFLLLYLVDEITDYLSTKESTPPTRQPHGILTLDNEPQQDTSHDRPISTCLHHGLPKRKPRYQDHTHRGDVYEVDYNADLRNIACSSTKRPDALGTGTASNKPMVTQYGTQSALLTPPLSGHRPENESLLGHGNHVEPGANTGAGHVGLAIALTFHAALEGLAIGLQKDPSKVFMLMGAVVTHKFVIAFCLGVQYAGSAYSALRSVLAITIFSGGSVLGIGLGMFAIKVEDNWAAVLIPALQGIAGGTLLYVTVSEVLPRERADSHKYGRRSAGLVQFFSVLLGFTLVYFLNRYLDLHDHVMPRA